MEFVLDCSVTLTWFFSDELNDFSDALRESLGQDSIAVVPSIWQLEVVNAFLNAENRKRLTAEKTDFFLYQLRFMPILIDKSPQSYFQGDILHLSRAHKLTSYDAAYLELALRLHIPIATLDKQLLVAAKHCKVPIMQ